MNEKELVEAAISVLHDAPREDATLLSGRQMAPIHNARLTDVTEVSNIQYGLLPPRWTK